LVYSTIVRQSKKGDRGVTTGMILRRVSALGILLSAFVGLGVLSFLGNRVLSGIFIVTALVVLVRHGFGLCPRCSNLACGFNPHRLGGEGSFEPDDCHGGEFSNMPITRTTVIPLLITGSLAGIGAWQYSPLAAIVLAAAILTAHSVFRELTCRHYGNDCVGNCNARYREWKVAQQRLGR